MIGVVSGKVLLVVFGELLLDIVVFDFWLVYGEMGYDVIMVLRKVMGDDLLVIVIIGDIDLKVIVSMIDWGIIVFYKFFDIEDL